MMMITIQAMKAPNAILDSGSIFTCKVYAQTTAVGGGNTELTESTTLPVSCSRYGEWEMGGQW